MICESCAKSFSHTGKYNRHLLVHSEQKPFECPLCLTRVSSNHALQRHLRSHQGTKPFHCSECQKNFSSKDHLHRHLNSRKHNKLTCPNCSKSFLREDAYTRHSCVQVRPQHIAKAREGRKKTNPLINWECPAPFCLKRYSTSFNLRTHIRTAHERRGFVCPSCAQSYLHQQSLSKHKCVNS